jgi:nicotinamide riboside kinase
MSRYDLVFVCDIDIAYDDTWDRSGDAKRTVMQKMILAELLMRRAPYVVLRGGLDARVDQVKRVLARFTHFANPLDGRW